MLPKKCNVHLHSMLSLVVFLAKLACILSQSTVVLCIIGMDEVLAHYACTFENSDLHFHFQWSTFDTTGIAKVNMYVHLKFG